MFEGYEIMFYENEPLCENYLVYLSFEDISLLDTNAGNAVEPRRGEKIEIILARGIVFIFKVYYKCIRECDEYLAGSEKMQLDDLISVSRNSCSSLFASPRREKGGKTI